MNTRPLNSDIKVCIVEDEDDLRETEVEILTELGFDIRGFSGASELYVGLLQQPCDVLILDIGLPGEDGFAIMQNLRNTLRIGIIMLTARGAVTDRVRGLQGGADVYLVKPVDMEELAANITSLARRLRISESPQNSTAEWRISSDGWLLSSPAGVSITLSGLERALLQRLLSSRGTTVRRDALVKALGYHADEAFSNRLDMLVSRLRRKVAKLTAESFPLHVVRGVGFSFSRHRC